MRNLLFFLLSFLLLGPVFASGDYNSHFITKDGRHMCGQFMRDGTFRLCDEVGIIYDGVGNLVSGEKPDFNSYGSKDVIIVGSERFCVIDDKEVSIESCDWKYRELSDSTATPISYGMKYSVDTGSMNSIVREYNQSRYCTISNGITECTMPEVYPTPQDIQEALDGDKFENDVMENWRKCNKGEECITNFVQCYRGTEECVKTQLSQCEVNNIFVGSLGGEKENCAFKSLIVLGGLGVVISGIALSGYFYVRRKNKKKADIGIISEGAV